MRPNGPAAWVALLAALGALLWTPRLAAAPPPPTRVSVLTMGPGEHPFTRFGHNAILLEWPAQPGERSGRDQVYNFGTFEFDGMRGVVDFMAGRFRYWLSVSTLERTRRVYAAEGRSLVAQELALTAAERAALADALALNARPERRYYDYDYYRDNCSTRVRDAIDRVIGGELQRNVVGPGRLSFRAHTLRLVSDTPWLYTGLDLALGTPTDEPTTRWQELFLPQELHDALATSRRKVDGRSVPLVAQERRLLDTQRAPPPALPPQQRGSFALVGAAIGAALAALGRGAASQPALRPVFGGVAALLGLVAGGLGCIFAGFWLLSKHWAAHRNLSLLLCPPWALGLAVTGILLALGRGRAASRLPPWLTLLVATSLAALVIGLASTSWSELASLAALVTPIWAGLGLGALLLARTTR